MVPEFFHEGNVRLDWGLGNPNKTAVLIACLMVVTWSLAKFRKWGFPIALALNTGLGIALIHTYSRGGLLAALAGQAIWWWRSTPARKKWQDWAGVVCLILLGVYASLDSVNATSRYALGMPGQEEDRSITNRLVIWSQVPRMMADAPGGWGIGNSGEAYTQWYQDTETRYRYRTLVSSHFTRLVEFGWPLRFLYLFGWLYILRLAWPRDGDVITPVPLACWVAFGVGGVFSTVDESPVLWILPILTLVLLLILRWREKDWKGLLKCTEIPIVGTVVLYVLMAGLPVLSDGPLIQGSPDVAHLGDRSSPPMVLVRPDERVLGLNYGAALREEHSQDSTGDEHWMVVRNPIDIPLDAQIVVFSGSTLSEEEFRFSDHPWIWLNPLNGSDFPMIKKAGQGAAGSVFLGELRRDPTARTLKRGTSGNWSLQMLDGRQDYISNWPDLLKTSVDNTP